MDGIMWSNVEGSGTRPCVLCGNEITMGKVWTDGKGGREHMVCEHCRLRLSSDIDDHDPGGDLGCNGREEAKRRRAKEGERTAASLMLQQSEQSEGALRSVMCLRQQDD